MTDLWSERAELYRTSATHAKTDRSRRLKRLGASEPESTSSIAVIDETGSP